MLAITVFTILLLLYQSAEKIVIKANMVSESKFINQFDNDDLEEIIRISQPSQPNEDSKSSVTDNMQPKAKARRKSILLKIPSKKKGIGKMKTIKEQESDHEESKRLTFKDEAQDVKLKDFLKMSKTKFNAKSFASVKVQLNNSANSENSNNILTGNKEENNGLPVSDLRNEIFEQPPVDVKNEAPELNMPENQLQRAAVLMSKKKKKEKILAEEEKDELDDIIDLIRNNYEHF
jgi:hypothetical protein